MFTVGIFTTHIPYLAFVVFYAYFLIFGVERANKGELSYSENSVQIEQHINDFQASAVQVFHFISHYADETSEQAILCCQQSKQKWRLCNRHTLPIQEYIRESLFCRPPPAVA